MSSPIIFDYDVFFKYYTNPRNPWINVDPKPPRLRVYKYHRPTVITKSGLYIIINGQKIYIDVLPKDTSQNGITDRVLFTIPTLMDDGYYWDVHYQFGIRDKFTKTDRDLYNGKVVYFHKSDKTSLRKNRDNCYYLTNQDITNIENIECLESNTGNMGKKFPITETDFPIIKEIIQRPFLKPAPAPVPAPAAVPAPVSVPVTPSAPTYASITRKTIVGGARKTRKIRYVITDYTRAQAKRLGVTIRPSTNPDKKLDVFKDGVKVASCGARGYNDYPTFWRKFGKKYADSRRRLYKQRHEKDRRVVGSAGYYADKLLW